MQRFRPTRAVIQLEHLAHNIRELKKGLGAQCPFFCPMIKADGYGHGDVEIAKRLEQEGVQHMGVALIEEGLFLREQGIKANLLFFGICDEKGARAVVDSKQTPVLSTWDQIRAFESVLRSDYPVQIKFDTGMHRLGFPLKDIPQLVNYFSNSKHMKVQGVLTHLHTGEDADRFDGASFEQLRLFQEVEKAFQPFNAVSHTLNSSGILNFINYQDRQLPHGISPHQGARPGLSIYGVSPIATSLHLKPVMSLRTETVKYQFIRQGVGTSYNWTWRASRDSVVAAVPVGYADGYHRLLSNRAEVLFRGERVPLVGNICMDYFMIDITDTLGSETAESLKPEPVTLFGEDEDGNQISAAELAQKAQTISWEILTSVGARVPREVNV